MANTQNKPCPLFSIIRFLERKFEYQQVVVCLRRYIPNLKKYTRIHATAPLSVWFKC